MVGTRMAWSSQLQPMPSKSELHRLGVKTALTRDSVNQVTQRWTWSLSEQKNNAEGGGRTSVRAGKAQGLDASCAAKSRLLGSLSPSHSASVPVLPPRLDISFIGPRLTTYSPAQPSHAHFTDEQTRPRDSAHHQAQSHRAEGWSPTLYPSDSITQDISKLLWI